MLRTSLIILFTILSLIKLSVMYLLTEFSDGLTAVNDWIPNLLDACIISLSAIMIIIYLIKHKYIELPHETKNAYIALKVGIIVFTLEVILMQVTEPQVMPLQGWQIGLLDVLLFSLSSVIGIYYIVLKPIVSANDHTYSQPSHYKSIIINSFLAYISFALILLIALVDSYHQQLGRHKHELLLKENAALHQAKNEFLGQLNHASRDLLIFANELNVQEYLNGETSLKEKLEQNYKNTIAFKDYYMQIRILDDLGKELIRVEHDNKIIKISPDNKLQDKSDRYYFKEGISLNVGEIFISPLDLNVEGNAVETPFQPMIRLVTPIANTEGKKAGVFVLNLYGNYLLNELTNLSNSANGKVMLLNSDAYWLFGGENNENWAFMFEDKMNISFKNKYPDVWNKIENIQQGEIKSIGASFIVNTMAFSPELTGISLFSDAARQQKQTHWPTWKLVSILQYQVMKDQLILTKQLMSILYISLLLFAGLGSILLVKANITREKYQEEIKKLAFKDSLTKLFNRRLFSEKIDQEIIRSRLEAQSLAVMYFDLDHFKEINDNLGHDAGDEALKESAIRLQNCLRKIDIVARLGGDEFAALLPHVNDFHHIENIANRIIKAFNQPFDLLGTQEKLGISIGITILLDTDNDHIPIIKRADRAMYEAKRNGKNSFRFFNHEMIK